jgi:hypothetical protein
MATMVNRQWFWATGSTVIPCRCTAQNIDDATATVLLSNGARHEVDAINLCRDESEASDRNAEKTRIRVLMDHMIDT